MKPMIPILMLTLLLIGTPLMAREIRQEHFSLMSETVRLTDGETFVLTGIPNHRQPACNEKVTKASVACRLPVVHFQLGSAELSLSEQTSLLAALARCAIASDTGLIIIGHTCSLGQEDGNRILSQKRAEQVATVLQTHGYAVSEIKAMGSQQPILGTGLADNRRVELAFSKP